MQRQVGDHTQGILIPQDQQAAGNAAFSRYGNDSSRSAQNTIYPRGAFQRVQGIPPGHSAISGGVGDGVAAAILQRQQRRYHIRPDLIVAPAGIQVAGAVIPQRRIAKAVLCIGEVIQRLAQRLIQQVAGQLGGAGIGAVEQSAISIFLQKRVSVQHLPAQGRERRGGILQPGLLVKQQGGFRQQLTADGTGTGQQHSVGLHFSAVVLQGSEVFFSQCFIVHGQVLNKALPGKVDAVQLLHTAQHQQGGFPAL